MREVWGRKDGKGGGSQLIMKPKILSWNVRGLNEVNKRLQIRSLIQSWQVNIVCLQEMKLDFIDRNIIRRL